MSSSFTVLFNKLQKEVDHTSNVYCIIFSWEKSVSLNTEPTKLNVTLLYFYLVIICLALKPTHETHSSLHDHWSIVTTSTLV